MKHTPSYTLRGLGNVAFKLCTTLGTIQSRLHCCIVGCYMERAHDDQQQQQQQGNAIGLRLR